MSDKLAVGVVGAGSIAEVVHLPAYAAHPRTDLVGVVEIDEDRRQAIADQFSIPHTFADHEQMFEDVSLDVVSICSPPHTHEAVFKAAVAAGCHVLCEKPLAPTLASARRMASAAAEADVITQMGYALRYMGNYQRASRIVRNQLLGPVTHATAVYHSPPPPAGWYFRREQSGGGVVADKFPHLLDFYLEVFGDQSLHIAESSLQSLRTAEVEDYAEVTLATDDVQIAISAGWTHQRWNRKHTLVGVDGMLEFNDEQLRGTVQGEWVYFKYGDLPSIQLGPLYQQWLKAGEDSDRARLNDFIEHVSAGDATTSAPIDRGIEITRLIEQIYETAGVAR